MLKLQTPVIDIKNRVKLSYRKNILLLGSCFANNIGKKLEDMQFNICNNPFGTIYNPISILNSINLLRNVCSFSTDKIIKMGSGSEKYCSFSHHTSFARLDKDEFFSNADSVLERGREAYKNADIIIITLGTSWCFRNIETGETVSNCLKRDAKEFERYRLSLDGTLKALEAIVSNCDKEFIFTVSPIRHFKDGAHENSISKSTLLLAVEEICSRYENCDYFPAYEIMMDELRDYRFYESDMIHPSVQAVNYIWERFYNWALISSEIFLLKEKEKKFRQGQHRFND